MDLLTPFLAPVAAVGLHIGSWHSEPGFNNANPGLYVVTEGGAVLGTYRNSLRKQTAHAGRLFELGPVDLSIGAATGYRAPLIPLGSISREFRTRELGAWRLHYVPKFGRVSTAHVVHLTYQRPLGK